MDIKIAPRVEDYLLRIAKHRDNLFDEENLSLIDDTSKLGRITKATRARYDRLIGQLPIGIYVRPETVADYITGMLQKTKHDALEYSPFVLEYPELRCCKKMKYRTGNIITGRDKEIDDILLAFTKSAKRGVILVGEPGVGKSQPISEPVLTEFGWKSMGDTQVGDKVFTPEGRLATVLGKFPQGIRKVFELEFSDGRKTRCSEEHLWKIYSKNWKRTGSESRVLELKTIKEIKENTRERLYIDLPEPRNLPDKDPFISPYILGVLIGDGSIIKNARFTNIADELISRVKLYLRPGYNLTISQQKTSKQVDIVRKENNLRKNEYIDELKRLGLLGKKAHEKFIPDEYLDLNFGEATELLAGLLDTDGTVSANGCIQYYTTSKELAFDVQYIARSIGCTAKIKEKKTKYGYNGEMREGRLCHVVSISKQWPRSLFRLTSKREKLPVRLKRTLRLELLNIKEVESEDCECIYIDDSDHLYITKDFIVTHNTAIVRAINNKLIERTVPRQLNGCYILNLDVPYVFAKFKEDPIGTIIKALDAASTHDKIILFIDEVHQLLGHRMNDVMKPYLTEQIRFIGSTTIDEYHSIITDDRALERRFTLIPVDEPNIERTQGMVVNTKSVYEEHHKCVIPDEVCDYAVVNGSRFLGHRKNPDKSLDLIDIACSIMYEKEIKVPEGGESSESGFSLPKLEQTKEMILNFRERSGDRVLTPDYVNLAISSITGIPFGEIKNSLNYQQVVKNIQTKVFGQDDQIESIANVVNIFKHVKADRDRPVSVICVVGPAGCGKSSACAALAKNLYGKEHYFIDYDMTGLTSEFMITELKGAPPGYVGYQKSGRLIKQIRNNPQSVIYFRGINKSHDTIQQYIVDACRRGMLIDSAEREAPLNNAVIVYAITLTDDEHDKVFKNVNRTMGFSNRQEGSESSAFNEAALNKIVGEELIKVADELIVFNPLDNEVLNKIFDVNVNEYLEMYDVDVDLKMLREAVLKDSKHGRDIVSKLSSEVPKFVFKKLKQEK